MQCEKLEDRLFLYADSLFKRDVVKLLPGKLYEVSHPITLRANQKVIGLSASNPPVIKYSKDTLGGIISVPSSAWNVRIRNVRFDGGNNTPAIHMSGNGHYIGNVSVTSYTGSAILLGNASNVTVENCNQKNYTFRGFIYGFNTKNIIVRNISTSGNLYENEFRFHGYDGLFLTNIKIDAANPQCHVYWDTKRAGKKDNALRIHDGKNAVINGLTATGNVIWGVMGENNGGYNDLRANKWSLYYQKMKMQSQVTATNVKIFGNLVLTTNLKFKADRIKIISWKRGECVSFDPAYGPFDKDSKRLVRYPAKGTFSNVKAWYVSNPGERNVNSLIKYFDRHNSFSNKHVISNWIPNGVTFKGTVFNRGLIRG